MVKAQRSYRLDAATIEAVEAWARDHGTTNTEAVEALLEAALNGAPAEDAPQDGGSRDEVVAILKANVDDLRAQVAIKDEQIRALTEIADHAQQLHAASVRGLLDGEGRAEAAGADEDADKGEDDRGDGSAAQEPQARPAGLWERIKAALMGY